MLANKYVFKLKNIYKIKVTKKEKKGWINKIRSVDKKRRAVYIFRKGSFEIIMQNV